MKILKFLKNMDLKNKIALCILFGIIIGSFLVFSRDSSLDYNVWVKDISLFKNNYNKHDYVVFKDPKSNKRLIKEIICIPGQKLHNHNNKFYCNDNFIAEALDFDIKGDKLPDLNINQIIPNGYFFVLGTNPRSYDSRYFGLVSEEEFIYKLHPFVKLIGL